MPGKKRLLLMRHAKSSWDFPELSDIDRPLNKRGKRDAPRMGSYLLDLGIEPARIYCSPAARTKATAHLLTSVMDIPETLIEWQQAFYHGGADAYLDAVRGSADELDTVMTIGHNPMTEEAIRMLAGSGFRMPVKTAAIACFEFEIDHWNQAGPDTSELKWFVNPADIKK